MAKEKGYLEKAVMTPYDETLKSVLGPGPNPPKLSQVWSHTEMW